jgi:hypothetical protein
VSSALKNLLINIGAPRWHHLTIFDNARLVGTRLVVLDEDIKAYVQTYYREELAACGVEVACR